MTVKNAKYVVSSPTVGKCPKVDVPEYAFIGRSNVGKSSLINMIANHKGLAKTSQMPGKTLLINHFKINDGEWYIVDLPGYGYAQKSKSQRDTLRKMIEDYVLDRQEMTLLFVLIDVRHDPQKIDMEFMDWLGEHEVPFAIVFTKADKLSATAARNKMDSYLNELRLHWEELPPAFLTSSEKKTGRDELLDFIEGVNKEVMAQRRAEEAGEAEEAPGPQNPE